VFFVPFCGYFPCYTWPAMIGTLVLGLFLSWVQVSSDTYIVKSSAGEERARRVLTELEEFHQLIGTFIFRSTQLPELPIEVLLIGDDQTMNELAPEYNGRKVGVAGYYQRGQDRDFIVLSGRVYPETLTNIVYHELTHYFLSRALAPGRPAWLNEGLAEYFATADIRDEEITLGGLSIDRMQSLRTNSLLPLKEFFGVDSSSSYYNEALKASVFYAQAWAFVHYLMHGQYSADFRRYLEALTKSEANLFDYVKVSERELETGFHAYVKIMLPRAARTSVKVAGEAWRMKIESIPDFEAQMSIAEIFLANGQFAQARTHLEAMGPELTRASYYRGVLARLAGDPGARDFFVDALLDPHLGPRAAVQLVQIGDLHIPAVRSLLEQAAAGGTRNPAVYLALSNIYNDDLRRIEEAVRLARQQPVPAVPTPTATAAAPAAEPLRVRYAQGAEQYVRYQLLSDTSEGPRVEKFVEPYYPAELLTEKLSGEVVMDVQITEEGKVASMWLVSATPDIFGTLATSAVRQWKFEAISAKIRVVLEFTP
jgi:TonB family protein